MRRKLKRLAFEALRLRNQGYSDIRIAYTLNLLTPDTKESVYRVFDRLTNSNYNDRPFTEDAAWEKIDKEHYLWHYSELRRVKELIGMALQESCRKEPTCPYKPLLPEIDV